MPANRGCRIGAGKRRYPLFTGANDSGSGAQGPTLDLPRRARGRRTGAPATLLHDDPRLRDRDALYQLLASRSEALDEGPALLGGERCEWVRLGRELGEEPGAGLQAHSGECNSPHPTVSGIGFP